MNKLLSIIGILTIVMGCNSAESELQNLWIGKYVVYNATSGNEQFSEGERKILKFGNDSLWVKNFYFDFITDEININVFKYKKDDRLILWNTEDKLEEYNIEISKNKLSFSDQPFQNKSVFEKLTEYNLGEKGADFYKLLLSSSFDFDSIRVEFKDGGRLIYPNFNMNIGDNRVWMIDKFSNELFLVVDGVFGFVLHIIEINSEGFKGIIYGDSNRVVTFKKVSQPIQFKIENLIGKWVVSLDKKNLPPVPPKFGNEVDFFEIEELRITDSTMQINVYFLEEKVRWETNREQDLILFEKVGRTFGGKKWKIILLDKNELIIERVPKMVEGGVERMKYERK